MKILAVAGALMLMACTAIPPEGPPPPEEEVPPPAQGAGACNVAAVQDMIGRQRSDAVGAEAVRRSGAVTIRWLAPDSVYTMDFREDRLNIDVDARGRITRLRCF
jgi:hypothetical protein